MAEDFDFIGFTFDGKHSYYDFGIYRTSGGDMYSLNVGLMPTDKTAEHQGLDGMYFLESNFKNQEFDISFAFDNLTEEKMREMKQWLNVDQPKGLMFDEWPYKEYRVTISGVPTIKFVCFDQKTKDGDVIRIYKGEGNIKFTCHDVYAKEVKNITRPGNIKQWKDGKAEYGDVPFDFEVQIELQASQDYNFNYEQERNLYLPELVNTKDNDSTLEFEFTNSGINITPTEKTQANDMFFITLRELCPQCLGKTCDIYVYSSKFDAANGKLTYDIPFGSPVFVDEQVADTKLGFGCFYVEYIYNPETDEHEQVDPIAEEASYEIYIFPEDKTWTEAFKIYIYIDEDENNKILTSLSDNYADSNNFYWYFQNSFSPKTGIGNYKLFYDSESTKEDGDSITIENQTYRSGDEINIDNLYSPIYFNGANKWDTAFDTWEDGTTQYSNIKLTATLPSIIEIQVLNENEEMVKKISIKLQDIQKYIPSLKDNIKKQIIWNSKLGLIYYVRPDGEKIIIPSSGQTFGKLDAGKYTIRTNSVLTSTKFIPNYQYI